MAQSPADDSKSQRSVLGILKARTGLEARVNLPDSDSEYGASPLVDPASPTLKLVPQGRGNYQFLGEIARGGMGVILKGHDTDLGRDVAVKVLDGELAKRPEVVQRFVEEAQIGGQLQHPGIVPVYELGLMADERPYFTMKLIKGRTLAALFQQRSTPADDRGRLLAIFESVCQTMAYAHSKRVLHRDLKPANVMVGAFGEVQVVDWGLAKVLQRGGIADEKRSKESLHTVIETIRSGSGSMGSHSLAGSVMGTPAYMAPEQAQGEVEKLDERADVFSLGAILCEILTGRPPYEERDGEVTLVHAARADIEPARLRIEACDADALLKRLCLDCLRPARGARPANAEAVAKVMHQYVVSVETRAQQAELAAAEARVKAAEERRARRLTVALGGSIAAVVLAVAAGWYWVEREHGKRIEQTRRAVEAAHEESIGFSQAGKPLEALASARRALELAEGGGGGAEMVERARNFVAKAQEEVGAADRERGLLEQDERLRSRLVDLRLEELTKIETDFYEPKIMAVIDARFTQAFKAYEVDLEGADVVPALKRIRERAIAEEVALALDDWWRVRRRLYGAQSEKAENLYLLAMDLDPQPHRRRLREAIAANDVTTMLALSSPENLPALGPGSICALISELRGDTLAGHQPEIFRILETARPLFPGDFLLQAMAGSLYDTGFRFHEALACRLAALSLRPRDVTARLKLGEMQECVGQLPEALTSLQACIALDPTNGEALDNLGAIQIMLGDYAAGLAYLSSSPEVASTPEFAVDLLMAQFYAGLLTREKFVRHVEGEFNPKILGSLLYALVEHPDPAQRDPQFVLRMLADRSQILVDWGWPSLAEIVARARLEDWPGAAKVLDDSFNWPYAAPGSGSTYRRPYLALATPMSFDFLAALVYAHVGRDGEARQAHKRGMVAWNELTRDRPAIWEHSDAMRWRREAEAVLAK